jgi:hypothetical protein
MYSNRNSRNRNLSSSCRLRPSSRHTLVTSNVWNAPALLLEDQRCVILR